jgi:hypothetical protein
MELRSFSVETCQPVEGRLTFVFGVDGFQPIEQVEGRHLVMGGENLRKIGSSSDASTADAFLFRVWFGGGLATHHDHPTLRPCGPQRP